MKLHIKVIQRNGVDIFVTSSMTMKYTKLEEESNELLCENFKKQEEIRDMARHTGDRYGIIQAHSLSQSLLI
jgi:hypothetical protein